LPVKSPHQRFLRVQLDGHQLGALCHLAIRHELVDRLIKLRDCPHQSLTL